MTSDLFVHSALCLSSSFVFWTCKCSVWNEGTRRCDVQHLRPFFFLPAWADRFHILTYAPYMTHKRKRRCSWADTLSNVHTPTHAAPPTLLEDGQRYRGNQFKQGLDGREVVRLAGKDMHHLKQQDITSDADGVAERSRLIRRGKRKPGWPSACMRHSHEISVGVWVTIAASLRVWMAEKPTSCSPSATVGFWCVCVGTAGLFSH